MLLTLSEVSTAGDEQVSEHTGGNGTVGGHTQAALDILGAPGSFSPGAGEMVMDRQTDLRPGSDYPLEENLQVFIFARRNRSDGFRFQLGSGYEIQGADYHLAQAQALQEGGQMLQIFYPGAEQHIGHMEVRLPAVNPSFFPVQGADGFQNLFQSGSPANGVVMKIRPGQREGHHIQPGGHQRGDPFRIEEHPIRGCPHPTSGVSSQSGHSKEIRVQEGFAPTLQMHHSGSGKGRLKPSEGLQGEVSVLPEGPIGRAGAVGAGCLAVRGYLNLNPVKTRPRPGEGPLPGEGYSFIFGVIHRETGEPGWSIRSARFKVNLDKIIAIVIIFLEFKNHFKRPRRKKELLKIAGSLISGLPLPGA
jgi:hypothetical protein